MSAAERVGESAERLQELARELGYALVAPAELERLRAWDAQTEATLAALDAEAAQTCDYTRRDNYAYGRATEAQDELRSIIHASSTEEQGE
jgi:hypothetical protein